MGLGWGWGKLSTNYIVSKHYCLTFDFDSAYMKPFNVDGIKKYDYQDSSEKTKNVNFISISEKVK